MRDFIKGKLKYIGLAILIIIVLISVFKLRTIFPDINFRYVKHYILSYGKFSALIFIIIYSLKPIVLVVPASLLSIVAGNIFGSFYAFIYSMIGCFFSATVGFFIARTLGKPFVDNVLKGKIVKLDSSIEKHGFAIMLLMRLSFVFPYDTLSYACGLTKVKYKDFILGSVLGIVPEIIVYSYVGKNLGKHFIIKKLIIPVIGIALIAFTSYHFYNNYRNRIVK